MPYIIEAKKSKGKRCRDESDYPTTDTAASDLDDSEDDDDEGTNSQISHLTITRLGDPKNLSEQKNGKERNHLHHQVTSM